MAEDTEIDLDLMEKLKRTGHSVHCVSYLDMVENWYVVTPTGEQSVLFDNFPTFQKKMKSILDGV